VGTNPGGWRLRSSQAYVGTNSDLRTTTNESTATSSISATSLSNLQRAIILYPAISALVLLQRTKVRLEKSWKKATSGPSSFADFSVCFCAAMNIILFFHNIMKHNA
jgi:hypothetical protein